MAKSVKKEITVQVALPDKPYPVIIGSGVRSRFWQLFENYGKGRAFWVTDRNVADAWGEDLGGLCTESATDLIILPPGEDQKSMITVERICQMLLRMGAERGDTLVACGGGVVGDITGFAAACYMRGIAFVQIPTTLLAMVDASVGGKTGVDLPEGKNLVGAFHQPQFVLADVDFLSTLDPRELRSGFAEVVKTALIGDPVLYDKLKKGGYKPLFDGDPDLWSQIVEACVRFKSNIVMQDERESNLRRILNFGHTIGHALEAKGNYQHLKHGEAIYWGMHAALDLSVSAGVLDQAEHSEILRLLDLFLTDIPAMEFKVPEVLDIIAKDKKVKGGVPHFILLEGIGKPLISDKVEIEQLKQSLSRLHEKMFS